MSLHEFLKDPPTVMHACWAFAVLLINDAQAIAAASTILFTLNFLNIY